MIIFLKIPLKNKYFKKQFHNEFSGIKPAKYVVCAHHEQEMSKSKLCKVFKFTLIYEFFDHGHGFKKAQWVKDFDT